MGQLYTYIFLDTATVPSLCLKLLVDMDFCLNDVSCRQNRPLREFLSDFRSFLSSVSEQRVFYAVCV